MKGKTAIVILNYNNYTDTINCIDSILCHNTSSVYIIIVDNGSTNESCNVLEKYILTICSTIDIVLLQSHKNLGYARGNNIGITHATSLVDVKNIMILNNDTLFIEDIIPGLLESLYNDNSCFIVSPLLYTKERTIDYHCARKRLTWKDICVNIAFDVILSKLKIKQKSIIDKVIDGCDEVAIEIPSGSCMLMKRCYISQVGVFDPNTFLYFEENIIYENELRFKLHNKIVPKYHLIHLGAQSAKETRSDFLDQCNLNSATYFVNEVLAVNYIKKKIFIFSVFIHTIIRYIYLLYKNGFSNTCK